MVLDASWYGDALGCRPMKIFCKKMLEIKDSFNSASVSTLVHVGKSSSNPNKLHLNVIKSNPIQLVWILLTESTSHVGYLQKNSVFILFIFCCCLTLYVYESTFPTHSAANTNRTPTAVIILASVKTALRGHDQCNMQNQTPRFSCQCPN